MILQEAINYETYKDKINKETFDKLVKIDPTTEKKYSHWIVRNWLKSTFPDVRDTDGWFEITKNLEHYTKLKTKNFLNDKEKNIMNIPSFKELTTLIYEHDSDLDQIEAESYLKNSKFKKWYEDATWLVGTPLNHEAACKYGANTTWCTAGSTEENIANSKEIFESYIREAPLIIVINKKVNEKWQIHFGEEVQFKDAYDIEVSNRQETIDSFPKEVNQAIFAHTKSFMFSPNKKEAVEKALNDPEKFKIIQENLYASSIVFYCFENDNIKHLDDIIDTELLRYAYGEWAYEKWSGMDDGSRTYGEEHPWEFLDGQEPANPGGIEINKEIKNWMKDPELWSDEQREEAGMTAESQSLDNEINSEFRAFSWKWKDRRYYSKKNIEEIIDTVIESYLSMEHYPKETVNTVVNLLDLLYTNDKGGLSTDRIMNVLQD